ncbi:MAG TPA: hypothetical protein VFN10_07965 [Thermoanaerobaculia bacterium]|nr:hypothetical protein [Thermoanaerobaculia bacterium]
MPKDTKEPQSYGSGADWTTGRTGQEVNDQKSAPSPEHRDFYDERREAEESDGHQGGHTSPFQVAESQQPSGNAEGGEDPATKVTSTAGGAKRESFFKRRDYNPPND